MKNKIQQNAFNLINLGLPSKCKPRGAASLLLLSRIYLRENKHLFIKFITFFKHFGPQYKHFRRLFWCLGSIF